jgi:hypothetical protein
MPIPIVIASLVEVSTGGKLAEAGNYPILSNPKQRLAIEFFFEIKGLVGLFMQPRSEETQGKRDLAWVVCTPRNNALQLDGVILDGADLHQFRLDYLFISAHSVLPRGK